MKSHPIENSIYTRMSHLFSQVYQWVIYWTFPYRLKVHFHYKAKISHIKFSSHRISFFRCIYKLPHLGEPWRNPREKRQKFSFHKGSFISHSFLSTSFSQLMLEIDWQCVILVNVICSPLTRKVGTTTYDWQCVILVDVICPPLTKKVRTITYNVNNTLDTANLRCFADFKVD